MGAVVGIVAASLVAEHVGLVHVGHRIMVQQRIGFRLGVTKPGPEARAFAVEIPTAAGMAK